MMNKLIAKTGMMLLLFITGACTSSEEDVTGNLTGRITDALTGEAIQGVNITLKPGGLSRTTGNDGTYDFAGIDAVQYTVQAQKADYKENTKTVSVLVGKTATADMSLTPIKKLELNATALNFGKTNNSLSFEIQNKGTNKFNWNISGLGTADWIEVNPGSGALEGGKSCTVQVNILREKLTANAELTLMVNADKESVALKVTVEVEKKTAKIEIDPSSLDFGTEESVLTFNIKNIGNAGDVKWNITGLDVDWITLTPMEGTLGEGKVQAVKVTLARALVKEHVKTAVLVNAGGESLPVEITADEKKVRSISAEPVQVEFGEEKEKISLTLTSYNGSTTYMLLKKENNAEWLSLSKTSGTIPQYDAANPAMKETVELTVNRNDLNAGTYSCTLIVRSDLNDLEIPVTMKVREKPAREFKVQPQSLAIGTGNSSTFTMFSNNGDTSYQLLTKENTAWLSFSKTTGTVKSGSSETVTVNVNRASLTAGDYNCTIIVRTDLGDTEIPTSMKVEEATTPPAADGSIIPCCDDLEFTLVSCKMSGNKAVIDYKVKNVSDKVVDLTLYGSNGGRYKSYIFDDYGNEYRFDYNEAELKLGTSNNYTSVSTKIPADVTVNASITIPDVAEEASVFPYIAVYAPSPVQSQLIFKNIKIEGRSSKQLPAAQTTGAVTSCSEKLEFVIVDCKRGNTGTVALTYRVRNISSKPLELTEYGSNGSSKCYIFDNVGNEYDFGYNGAWLTLGLAHNYTSVGIMLPPQVWVDGKISIPDVSEEATEMSNITIYTPAPEQSQLIFKNVKIR